MPAIIEEDVAACDATDRSRSLISQTWGESLSMLVGVNTVQAIVQAVILLIFGGIGLASYQAKEWNALIITAGIAMALLIVILM